MKLGLRGVSVLFASGDSGVASRSGCLGNSSTIFNPDWPARYYLFPLYLCPNPNNSSLVARMSPPLVPPRSPPAVLSVAAKLLPTIQLVILFSQPMLAVVVSATSSPFQTTKQMLSLGWHSPYIPQNSYRLLTCFQLLQKPPPSLPLLQRHHPWRKRRSLQQLRPRLPRRLRRRRHNPHLDPGRLCHRRRYLRRRAHCSFHHQPNHRRAHRSRQARASGILEPGVLRESGCV